MKYLGIFFCLVFMSSCELTPEQQANWEKLDKALDEFNEGLGEANATLNQGNPNYQNNRALTGDNSIKMTYFLDRQFESGNYKTTCVYTLGSEEVFHTIGVGICPLSMDF